MAILAFLAALILGLFGLGSGSASSGSATTTATPAQTVPVASAVVLTQADAQTAVDVGLHSGVPINVHLSHRWRWSPPRVSGPARLQRVDFVTDPGYDAWIVEPTGKGIVTVSSTGRPGPRRLTLTIHVD